MCVCVCVCVCVFVGACVHVFVCVCMCVCVCVWIMKGVVEFAEMSIAFELSPSLGPDQETITLSSSENKRHCLHTKKVTPSKYK